MSTSNTPQDIEVTVGWSGQVHDAVGTLYSLPELQNALPKFYETPAGPWVRANMVSTIDGAATGEDGTSGSISTAVDREVFLKVIRPWADAVVVGAGTARDEEYGPVATSGHSDPPVLVVVSGSGNIPDALREDPRTFLAVPAATAKKINMPRERLIVGEPDIDPEGLLAQLHERGYRRILVEGGPGLLAQWLDSKLVNDLCLTTAGMLAGGAGKHITGGSESLDVSARPELVLVAQDTILTRWVLS